MWFHKGGNYCSFLKRRLQQHVTHFQTCSNTLCALTCIGYDRASLKEFYVLETPPSTPLRWPYLSATLFAECHLLRFTHGGKSRTEYTVMCLSFQDYKPASIVLMQKSTGLFLIKYDEKRSTGLSLFVPQITYTLQFAQCASGYLSWCTSTLCSLSMSSLCRKLYSSRHLACIGGILTKTSLYEK